jgi:hypothetical protein
MKLIIATLLLCAAPCFADSCSDGSLAEASSASCDLGGIGFQPLEFSYSQDGVISSIDPSLLTVSFIEQGSDRIMRFNFNSALLQAGHSATFDLEVLLLLPTQHFVLIQPFSDTESGPGSFFSIDQAACLNGTFAPDCTATLLPIGPSGAFSGLLPPSTIDVKHHWDFSTTDSPTQVSGPGLDIRTSYSVPEPSGILLLISALPAAGLCNFRRR